MNPFMMTQCREMQATLEVFRESLRLAALEDDRVIDREEEKQLKKLNAAIDSFEKELEKVMK